MNPKMHKLKMTWLCAVALLCVGMVEAQTSIQVNTATGLISADDEISLQVERSSGAVLLRMFIKDITQYDHILVERSAETPNYFGKCRYIACNEVKPINGYLLQYDRYPYAANKDVYYRVKTVSKTGAEKVYPAVLLAASVK